jgi:hypothetical protein
MPGGFMPGVAAAKGGFDFVVGGRRSAVAVGGFGQ